MAGRDLCLRERSDQVIEFACSCCGDDMIWTEAVTAGSLIDRQQAVQEMRASLDETIDRSLSPDESRDLIHRVRAEMEHA